MQRGRGGRDDFFGSGDPFGDFGAFGGFGGHRNLVSSFFGGRDPFDDPFFSRPFGSMFGPSMFSSAFGDSPASGFLEHQVPQPTRSKGPVIEELTSDDDEEAAAVKGVKEKKDNPRKHSRSSKEPYVEDLDDVEEERKSKQMQFRNDFNMTHNTQPQSRSFSFQSSTVTYGGVNGPYYTSSTTRRAGGDGVIAEERKEADSTTGRATHRLSRGIHDKGHSFTRKLNSDGKVEALQTLHNLNEDELDGFEETWKGNARKHLPGWNETFNFHGNLEASGSGQNARATTGGWALPSTEQPRNPYEGGSNGGVRRTSEGRH